MQTPNQYNQVIETCRQLFLQKAIDYGTAWQILRLPSVTDQILIKAERIRSIQEKKSSKVNDSIESDFVGIVNYCIIASLLIDLKENKIQSNQLNSDLSMLYDSVVSKSFDLMMNKNHDYGEAWRKMRVSSMVDLILMKLYRLKQIENNNGVALVSEGIEANYMDILNYAVFSLILINDGADCLL